MKNILAVLLWLMGLPGLAAAQSLTFPAFHFGANGVYSLGISPNILAVPSFEGVRDYHNGQWLAGYGIEVLDLEKAGNQAAFIEAVNLFNADEAGKGSLGAHLGFRPVNLINDVAQAAGMTGVLIPLPKWLTDVSNWTTIESGYAYRLQNIPGVSRWEWTVGGQVKIPLNLAKGL